MGSFIPLLSDIAAPLRELTHKGARFEWSTHHEDTFTRTKNTISEETVLSYFDPKADLTLLVDASKKAVGVTLVQHNKPGAFASKAL